MGTPAKGRMQHHGDGPITRTSRDIKTVALEDKAAVFFQLTVIVKSEDLIKLERRWEFSQMTPAFLKGAFPALVGCFLCFSVNMTFVKVSHLFLQDFIGGGEIFDAVAFT